MDTIHGEYSSSLTDGRALGDLTTPYLGTDFPANEDTVVWTPGQQTALPWINNKTQTVKKDYVGTNMSFISELFADSTFLG